MSDFVHYVDPEKSGLEADAKVADVTTVDVDHDNTAEVARVRDIQQQNRVVRSMRHAEEWLDSKMGIELQGIDRIPEEEKRPPHLINIFLLWWSLNVHVGVVPLGLLGPQFGLTLGQSVGASFLGTFYAIAAFREYRLTILQLGLRAIATSRYSFGWWGAKLCSVLNVIVGGGFAVVNYVVVGQVLSAVSDYTMSITVGIVIIAVISYIVSIFGFRLIHTFEKYSWIGTFILFCVLIAQAAPNIDPNAPGFDTGLGYAGSFLSILAINFSNASGWCSISSDYYCNYPAKTPAWKIFALSFFGVVIPTTFSVVIGAAIGVPVFLSDYTPYADAYNNHSLGGLIFEIYHPVGWSKFCLILLTFSVLGNNIAINYSSGLSLQLLGYYFHAVPRFIWSLLVAVVIAVLAIAGQQSLETIVNDFVSLLGYWTVSFTIILLIEDKFFRRHDGYVLTAWNQPENLPPGIAAVLALLCGYLGGGVPGMSQTWYIGPIALLFGEYGGDVGVYMSGAITLLVYPIARTIEKKHFGR
ncbi:hypothetical protein MMC15_003217 [Xylographa vitiligo]|nr:hypothetical protein [Xylographa vitiligo]